MRKAILFLTLFTFSLNTFDFSVARVRKAGGQEKEHEKGHVVLRWTADGLKVYELEDTEDAKFVAEEAKFRGEKFLLLKGIPERIYLSCAMGYFLLENHPRINVKLLMQDIRKLCNGCKPVNCGITREEAINLLERGGARDIANELKESYRRAEQ